MGGRDGETGKTGGEGVLSGLSRNAWIAIFMVVFVTYRMYSMGLLQQMAVLMSGGDISRGGRGGGGGAYGGAGRGGEAAEEFTPPSDEF